MSEEDRNVGERGLWGLACMLFGIAGILCFVAVMFVLATP